MTETYIWSVRSTAVLSHLVDGVMSNECYISMFTGHTIERTIIPSIRIVIAAEYVSVTFAVITYAHWIITYR